MHENRNLFLFLIEINNMHCTRHILPIPRTCMWRRCGWYGVSWHLNHWWCCTLCANDHTVLEDIRCRTYSGIQHGSHMLMNAACQ